MFKTIVMPFAVGILCFLITAAVMEQVMPLIDIDNAIKGLIKVIAWIVAFAV